MSLPFSVTFTGTNSTWPSPYSTEFTAIGSTTATPLIQSNAACMGAAGSGLSVAEDALYWNTDVFGNDQYARATCGSAPQNDNWWGPIIRASGSGGTRKYYYAVKNNNPSSGGVADFEIGKVVNGTRTTIALVNSSDGYGSTAGSYIYLQVQGTTITAQYWKGGTSRTDNATSYTDSALTSGSAGFLLSGAADCSLIVNGITNAQGGNITVAGPALLGQICT